ncbi:MAG: hypothetical protein AAGA72_10450 [Pseudomonadota bacterium]
MSAFCALVAPDTAGAVLPETSSFGARISTSKASEIASMDRFNGPAGIFTGASATALSSDVCAAAIGAAVRIAMDETAAVSAALLN